MRRFISVFYILLRIFYFAVRLCFVCKTGKFAGMGFKNELLILFYGPKYLFGRGVDIRWYWERNGCHSCTLPPLLPSQADCLEISILILRRANFLYKFLWLLYLFTHSYGNDRGNHSIGKNLAIAKLLSRFKIRKKYELKAYKEFRLHTRNSFYNEGSTHYHIFTVYLFKLYLEKEKFLKYFRSNNELSYYLFLNPILKFGDSDPYVIVPGDAFYLVDTIDAGKIKKFQEEFFYNYSRGDVDIYIKRENNGDWGHEKDQAGCLRVAANGQCLIRPFTDSSYTRSIQERGFAKYCALNGPMGDKVVIKRYFEPVLKESTSIIEDNNTITVRFRSNRRPQYHINVSRNTLKIWSGSSTNFHVYTSATPIDVVMSDMQTWYGTTFKRIVFTGSMELDYSRWLD